MHSHIAHSTCSCVPDCPPASSQLCVICPLTGMSPPHPTPPQLTPLSFIQPGVSLQQDILNILRYPQLCSRCAQVAQSSKEKQRQSWNFSQGANEKQPSTSSHSSVSSFLFMLAHVCSLPLCCIPKVTAGFCYCGSCLTATERMGLLSLEVCDQRASVPIDSDQTSASCFFDELCLNKLA